MALVNGAAWEPSLRVNSFEPGTTSVVERLQRGCTSQTLLEASKSDLGTPLAKAPVKSGIKVKVDSGQRNGGSVSCPPGLARITLNPFWSIAQEGTCMSRSQGLRHANQSRTQEKQKLGHPHEPPSLRKDFLDEALLISSAGSNMLYVMFKNQIVNLIHTQIVNCHCCVRRVFGLWPILLQKLFLIPLGLMIRQRLAWLSIGCRKDLVFEVAFLMNPKQGR